MNPLVLYPAVHLGSPTTCRFPSPTLRANPDPRPTCGVSYIYSRHPHARLRFPAADPGRAQCQCGGRGLHYRRHIQPIARRLLHDLPVL